MGQPATAPVKPSPIYRIARVLVVFVYGFAIVSIAILAMAVSLRDCTSVIFGRSAASMSVNATTRICWRSAC